MNKKTLDLKFEGREYTIPEAEDEVGGRRREGVEGSGAGGGSIEASSFWGAVEEVVLLAELV